jgi:hypothetical protein
MLISMCSCAPGYFRVDLFSIFRVIAIDLLFFLQFSTCAACNSKRIWPRVMKLKRNVDQHVQLCTWVFSCGFIQYFQSYCHWLIFFCNFQLVSHVTQKGFDLESWNLRGMLISMCSCAPGYFRVDLLSILRVIALDLLFFFAIFNLCRM